MVSKLRWLNGIMLVAFSIGLLVVLAGCPENETPLVDISGVWEGTWISTGGDSFTLNMEFKADGTFTETMVDIPFTFSVTFSGTYVHDSAAIVTITVTSTTNPSIVALGTMEPSTYSLSADNNTMTSTNSSGTGTFTRQ